jgi:hypothetical protein
VQWEYQINIRLFVSMKLRAVGAVVFVVSSVSCWSEVVWHRYRVLELKFSNSACNLGDGLLTRPSLYCSGPFRFGFFHNAIQPQRDLAVRRRRSRDFALRRACGVMFAGVLVGVAEKSRAVVLAVDGLTI